MKKTLLFLFLITFSFAVCQTSRRVFFIGNSYTNVNNLPGLIKNVADSAGDILEHQSQTPEGLRFRAISTVPLSPRSIRETGIMWYCRNRASFLLFRNRLFKVRSILMLHSFLTLSKRPIRVEMSFLYDLGP
ncbi:hypothetical protein EJ377_13490 (plasmid) [Chryseobacterium arthrosphaerae]|uniref:SGNH/GDSL hydrolase family protein n=1 Tax=Chryseobacterium arthrosphaerae TaxID=651561 RepID=A0A432DY05_9FLAO|nr:hypothetical protein EJ377_13490 [Chryseobacterium arthrosphaerae]